MSQILDDPQSPQITYRRGAAEVPTPVLRGTGIRVQTIVLAKKSWALSIEEIASDYNLSKNQVVEALKFYETHQVEIDASVTAEEKLEMNIK